MPLTASTSLDREQQLQLVYRVVAAEPFRRAPRLREFLLFVCQRAIADPGADLSEYEIGFHVFHRQESFNPAEDSIVRSSARQLRLKLKEYFAADGHSEEFIIDIPKGSYVPTFLPRTPPRSETPESPPAVSTPATATRAPQRWVSLFATVGAVLGLLALVYFVKPAAPRPPSTLIGTLFAGQTLTVVLPDSALNIVNAYRPRILNLDEYLRSEEQKHQFEGDSRGRFPGNRLITSFRDVLFLQRL